jgi:hypothetical protein
VYHHPHSSYSPYTQLGFIKNTKETSETSENLQNTPTDLQKAPPEKEASETSGNVKTTPSKSDIYSYWYLSRLVDDNAHWQSYGQQYQRAFMRLPAVSDQTTIHDQDDPDYVSAMIEYRAWLSTQPKRTTK